MKRGWEEINVEAGWEKAGIANKLLTITGIKIMVIKPLDTRCQNSGGLNFLAVTEFSAKATNLIKDLKSE
ncbi:MAG TPA: hypothetical protein VEP89_12060 [Draconibacterium sp.]|nr:hypothetical protein [Draconibacterium sp.]